MSTPNSTHVELSARPRPGQLTAMISSTALDLPEHRAQAHQACLDAGVFPIGMEQLPARDATGIAASLEMVEQADIYVGLYAFRYGWVPDDEDISITEMEFNHAVARKAEGKLHEILIFTAHKEHAFTADDIEADKPAQEKLSKFKTRAAAGRVRKDFKSAEELRRLVFQALIEFKSRQQRTADVAPAVEFTVEEGDITNFDADVMVLKHAQNFYGADATVALKLQESGVYLENLTPKIDEHAYLESRGSVRAAHVLFIGTPQLFEFEYDDIQRFSARALEVLAEVSPEARRVVMTMHGVGYGLDETAAAHAQFAGLWGSLSQGNMPRALEAVSIIDIHSERVKRLRELFDSAFKRADYAERDWRKPWAYRLDTTPRRQWKETGAYVAQPGAWGVVETVARGKEASHVFVAMPFKEEMEDIFYYGIQKSVHSIGYLCERIDQESFTGDILERMKKRIETASLVIADLTGDNPNVFLEVGYAWGKGRPTVLVVKQGKQQLRFDVQGQRCVKYKSIRNLEELLTKMLGDLKSDGSI